MKAFIWNSKGIRDTCKHSVIQDNIREQNLDIVAILETGRTNFSASFLRMLSAGKDFIWFCLPSRGRSGRILVCVKAETLVVKDADYGDFLVRLNLRSKKDGFEWSFVAVYGAAQEAQKPAFLAELVRICDSPGTPMIVGGDFNILRSPREKSSGNYNAKWPFIFNAIIGSLNLRELILSGR
jgi:exonuclease III